MTVFFINLGQYIYLRIQGSKLAESKDIFSHVYELVKN